MAFAPSRSEPSPACAAMIKSLYGAVVRPRERHPSRDGEPSKTVCGTGTDIAHAIDPPIQSPGP
jgi:hypothetical protein